MNVMSKSARPSDGAGRTQLLVSPEGLGAKVELHAVRHRWHQALKRVLACRCGQPARCASRMPWPCINARSQHAAGAPPVRESSSRRWAFWM